MAVELNDFNMTEFLRRAHGNPETPGEGTAGANSYLKRALGDHLEREPGTGDYRITGYSPEENARIQEIFDLAEDVTRAIRKTPEDAEGPDRTLVGERALKDEIREAVEDGVLTGTADD